jgi:hypothetical protein
LMMVIDAIVVNRYSSPPYEYIEGGDFRVLLKLLFSRHK